MNKLNEVVQEIVVATGYPAEDLLDGIVIEQPIEHPVPGEGYPAAVHCTRFVREESGAKRVTLGPWGHLETHTRLLAVDLPEGLWEKLEQACLADDPSLKGRKLVGGVELRNFHAYFLPEGEDQQWISTDTFSF